MPIKKRLRHPFAHGLGAALAGAALFHGSLVHAQNDKEPWTVVVANSNVNQRADVAALVAQQLRQELGMDVRIWRGEGDRATQAATWALQKQATRRAILMLSEGSSSVMGNPNNQPYHLSHFEPVAVLMEMPWCLFALKKSPVIGQANVLEWLRSLQRPVNVAIGVPRGKPMMWAYVLTLNGRNAPPTPMQVNTHVYSGGVQLKPILENKADIAIGRCGNILSMGPDVQVIARAQKPHASYMPELPSFTEVGLPPLDRGWYGAFVPQHMTAQDKAVVAKALERAAQSPELKRAIEYSGQSPLLLNHERSKTYINEYKRTWQAVADLLQWSGVETMGPLREQ